MQLTELESNIARAPHVFDRVLVPVDYSMASHRALGLALELRRTHGSALCLFHAAESTGGDEFLAGIGSPSVGGDWVAESKERLLRFLDNVAPGKAAGIDVRARVGLPIAMLVAEARAWRPTLVVAAIRFQPRFPFRSPAERLIRRLRVPVLLVPADLDAS
jgi:nucleotide-binding universal stress UspA family protein